MAQLYRINLRVENSIIVDLKKISIQTHNGRYQTLIKDVLMAYVKSYKKENEISKKTKKIQDEIIALMSRDKNSV